jgi:putative phosphoribosyl transferase
MPSARHGSDDVWPCFLDRRDAGVRLAEQLGAHRGANTLVLGIPRGGVPVAAEVARALDAELDVIVARKLGAPMQPELAVGAVTADGTRCLNEDIARALGLGGAELARAAAEAMAEAARRERRFRRGAAAPDPTGRTVILVDDGLATGATMRAAARSVRRRRPARLVIAVPVGAPEACEAMRAEADEVVCLARPEPFWAVGTHYVDFGQTTDEEVERLLAEHARRRSDGAAPAGI